MPNLPTFRIHVEDELASCTGFTFTSYRGVAGARDVRP
jgi:hypothetical protein